MADIIKSEQKGKMITCCRDKNFVFLKYLGKGDTDTCERYNIDELEQIAEHLLIYCKHNKGCEE